MNIYSRKRSTIETFIKRALEIHGAKYNYDFVVYVNARTKVKIWCSTHGMFEQTPDCHLNRSSGCPQCWELEKPTKLRKSLDKFVSDSLLMHNSKYLYDNVVYVNAKTKVEIICKTHGFFWQTPSNHTHKTHPQGCPTCAGISVSTQRRKLVAEFILEAIAVHGAVYEYDEVEYVNYSTKVKIRCKVHGIFLQEPKVHVSQKCGCPKCSNSVSVSKAEIQWLKSFNNDAIVEQYKICLSDSTYIKADGYDPNTNTIYEYNGKYWHGHPDKSDPDEVIRGKTAGDRYIETLMREIRLKELGYNIVSIWK